MLGFPLAPPVAVNIESNMTRSTVRFHNRSVSAGRSENSSDSQRLLSADSALFLLDRSIRFGHTRLAVLRLVIAVDVGAQVPREHFTYCHAAAEETGDSGLQELLIAAAAKVRFRSKRCTA